MIKITELRIGNWVLLNDLAAQKIPYKIETIFGNDDQVKTSFSPKIFSVSLIDPIHLTPKILEYLGFDWHGGLTFTKTSSGGITFRMHLDHYTDKNPWFKTEVELNVDMGFKYVSVAPPDDIHELQNLYFALAGEELEMIL